MQLGKFIVLEGLEGAGKSTAQKPVVDTLSSLGIKQIVCTKEPGGTPLATQIRALLTNEVLQEPPTPLAELLLLYAARHQLVETVIRPALAQGTWVIADRHNLSTHAYQGAGRQLSAPLIKQLTEAVLGSLKPHLTLYFDVTPEIGMQRIAKRGTLDRIEQETMAFFHRARDCYLACAKDDPSIHTIDANQSISQVHQQLIETIKRWHTQAGGIHLSAAEANHATNTPRR